MPLRVMLSAEQYHLQQSPSMATRHQELSKGQNPEILWVGCSDSRAPADVFTGMGPGELFMVRNIGNMVPRYTAPSSSEKAAITYAFKKFNIRDVVVCAHSTCGAMEGLLTIGIEEKEPDIGPWLINHAGDVLNEIAPANKPSAKDIIHATQLNVIKQLENFRTYPFVAEKIEKGELRLHGWIYDIPTGMISQAYDAATNQFIPFPVALQNAIVARRDQIVSVFATQHLQKHNDLEQPSMASIFPHIKDQVIASLWEEIGKRYENQEDPKFLSLINAIPAECSLPQIPNYSASSQLIGNNPQHLFSSKVSGVPHGLSKEQMSYQGSQPGYRSTYV